MFKSPCVWKFCAQYGRQPFKEYEHSMSQCGVCRISPSGNFLSALTSCVVVKGLTNLIHYQWTAHQTFPVSCSYFLFLFWELRTNVGQQIQCCDLMNCLLAKMKFWFIPGETTVQPLLNFIGNGNTKKGIERKIKTGMKEKHWKTEGRTMKRMRKRKNEFFDWLTFPVCCCCKVKIVEKKLYQQYISPVCNYCIASNPFLSSPNNHWFLRIHYP